MPSLPARPDLRQLRRQARDLQRAAAAGDARALTRLAAVTADARPTLALAQLALAREHGFDSWARLRTEVERREVLDEGDPQRLRDLLERDPQLAVAEMTRWRDHPRGAAPLNYVAMLRYDTARGVWRNVPGTGELARLLIAAGAPVNGDPSPSETPLMTAASYGDAEVARVLIEFGADLDSIAPPDSGGVPGGSAVTHAAVFGMTEVLDVLVAAGAQVGDPVMAAAAGDLTGIDLHGLDEVTRVLMLVMAADHERLPVIDALLAAGTPVDAVDPHWHRQALRTAAENGRAAAVRALLRHGADPTLTDGRGRTALQLARAATRTNLDRPGYPEVEALLTATPT